MDGSGALFGDASPVATEAITPGFSLGFQRLVLLSSPRLTMAVASQQAVRKMSSCTCANCETSFRSYSTEAWKRCPTCGYAFSTTWSNRKQKAIALAYASDA